MSTKKNPETTAYWCNENAKGHVKPGENYEDTDTRSSLMKARGYQFVDGKWVP